MALDFVRKRQGARAYLDRLPQPSGLSSRGNRRGLGPAITIWPSFLPLRQGITLRRTEQEFTAGAFDEQRVDEASAAANWIVQCLSDGGYVPDLEMRPRGAAGGAPGPVRGPTGDPVPRTRFGPFRLPRPSAADSLSPPPVRVPRH